VGLEPGAARPLGEPAGASPVEISRGLLGLQYRWGGTDSTIVMDCSGLVFRAMGLAGVSVPRDADDQFNRAPFQSRDGWEPARGGDLIFFGEESVTHVGFYLGDGTYLSEHGSSGTVVRGVDEDPYWGFARYIS
jgi:cell wall-associated NlpC family hydrolase